MGRQNLQRKEYETLVGAPPNLRDQLLEAVIRDLAASSGMDVESVEAWLDSHDLTKLHVCKFLCEMAEAGHKPYEAFTAALLGLQDRELNEFYRALSEQSSPE